MGKNETDKHMSHVFSLASVASTSVSHAKGVVTLKFKPEIGSQTIDTPNRHGKNPTCRLIQRGIEAVSLGKSEVKALGEATSRITREEASDPVGLIKTGLASKDSAKISEGLTALLEMAVTSPPKGKTKAAKAAKAPAKAAKAPAVEAPKAPAVKAPKGPSLAQRKMAAIETLIAQNAEIISLLK
tara:strand:- start:73 stop:627 length:555 start_codon:yes stop_codon:yes gene_type:complete